MRSRYLADLFSKHTMQAQAGSALNLREVDGPVMVIYGTDEFQIDRSKGQLHLADTKLRCISCPSLKDLSKKVTPDWVGVAPIATGGFEMIVGFGNPFTSNLPCPAVPFSILPTPAEAP